MRDDEPAEERVKVVYCGGCNPHIDRTAVAAGLPVADPDILPGTTVRLSGCPRACASGHQLVAEGDEQAGAGVEGAREASAAALDCFVCRWPLTAASRRS